MMRKLAATLIFGLVCSVYTLPAFAATECGTAMSKTSVDPSSAGCPVVKASAAGAATSMAAAAASAAKASDTATALKQSVQRSANFIAKFKAATVDGAPTLILLHGSGGDESSLMELASKAYPGAALLGIRGRVVQDGINRWYKRLTPTTFDQDDIRAEAEAFAKFMAVAQKDYKIDFGNAIFLGYSNGANLLAAMSMLHPELVQRAALLRPMMVLQKLPDVNLAKDSILMVPGKEDKTYGPFATGLEEALIEKGAMVTEQTVDLGHLLGDADVGVVGKWMASLSLNQPAETVSASAD
jgi:phospholipase/carboxylesterase